MPPVRQARRLPPGIPADALPNYSAEGRGCRSPRATRPRGPRGAAKPLCGHGLRQSWRAIVLVNKTPVFSGSGGARAAVFRLVVGHCRVVKDPPLASPWNPADSPTHDSTSPVAKFLTKKQMSKQDRLALSRPTYIPQHSGHAMVISVVWEVCRSNVSRLAIIGIVSPEFPPEGPAVDLCVHTPYNAY